MGVATQRFTLYLLRRDTNSFHFTYFYAATQQNGAYMLRRGELCVRNHMRAMYLSAGPSHSSPTSPAQPISKKIRQPPK